MKVKAREASGYVLLTPSDDITFQTCHPFRSQMDKALEMFPAPWVVIDLSHVSFINSSGVGVMVEMLRRLRRRGGGLCLINVHEQLRRLLEKTKLDRDLLIADDEASLADIMARGDISSS